MAEKTDLPPNGGRCMASLIAWNTLDSRSRTNDFNRSLQAEIRDPLWMLTRQWQWGEFNAEDAGTAVFSRVSWQTSAMNTFAPGSTGNAQILKSDQVPLEATAERLFLRTLELDFGLRLELGRQWMKILVNNCLTSGIKIQPTLWFNHSAYTFKSLPSPGGTNDIKASYALENSNAETWAVWATVTGRAVDGFRVYSTLLESGAIANVEAIPAVLFKAICKSFVDWVRGVYYEPDGNTTTDTQSWSTEQLEYKFKCSAPNTDPTVAQPLVFEADSFKSGTLDWYGLDFAASGTQIGSAAGVVEQKSGVDILVPNKMTFNGMPNSRWWAFEHGNVSFGNIDVNANDLARILLMDFMLNYSNDWYLIPFAVPIGRVVHLKGIEVTDVFGVRTLIRSANANASDANMNAWSLFTHDVRNSTTGTPDTRFLLAPAIGNHLESAPIESVLFYRDEVANMVWGVEQIIPDQLLGGRDGHAAAVAALEKMEQLIPSLPPTPGINKPDDAATIRYRLATTVPEYYIPFLPVQKNPGTSAEIMLRRGAMPRTINEQNAGTIAPRTILLRRKYGNTPVQIYPLYVNEEEVPRTGVTVTTSWQRTRWHEGRTMVWLGRKVQTSKEMRPSGLKFDHLEPNE